MNDNVIELKNLKRVTQKEIAKNLNLLAQKIIDQERLARKYLSKNSLKLEDEVYRSS